MSEALKNCFRKLMFPQSVFIGEGIGTVFWDKVELLRRSKKLTYRKIAGIMGTAETTVSSMRKFGTEPRVSDAVKIADALGVEVRELIS